MDFYKNNGWVVYKNIFKQEDIVYILENIEEYLLKYKTKMSIYDTNFTKNNELYSIHCLHKFDERFKKFLNNSHILIDILKKLLDTENIEITEIQAFYKPPFSNMESPIHQDNALWCLENNEALTVCIALDKINKTNGGLKLWSKTQNLGDLKHRLSYKLGTSQTIDECEYSKFNLNDYIINDLEIGDIQIHNSRTIHSSEYNNSNKKRRSFVFGVKTKNNKLNIEKYNIKQENLIKQQKFIKNNI